MNKLKGLFPAQEGFWPYIYMSNIGIPVYFMAQEHSIPRMAAGFSLLLLLLVLYRQMLWKPEEGLLAAGAYSITLALAFGYHPMYLYAVFIYLQPVVKLPLRLLIPYTVVYGAGAGVLLIWSGFLLNPPMLLGMLPPLFGGLVLPYMIKGSLHYKELSEQLQAAQGQVQRMAQEEERHRIARELHDTLGHTLSLISLKSDLVAKLVTRKPEQAVMEVREIQETARSALKQMRSLVAGMNKVQLWEELQHAAALCAAAGISLDKPELDDEEGALTLTPLQETILAMCLREAVTNLVKHSRASKCWIHMAQTAVSFQLTVEDNGAGFRPEELAQVGGSGVHGMMERLRLLEGRLDLDSNPGRGTRFTFEVPIVIRHTRREWDDTTCSS